MFTLHLNSKLTFISVNICFKVISFALYIFFFRFYLLPLNYTICRIISCHFIENGSLLKANNITDITSNIKFSNNNKTCVTQINACMNVASLCEASVVINYKEKRKSKILAGNVNVKKPVTLREKMKKIFTMADVKENQ